MEIKFILPPKTIRPLLKHRGVPDSVFTTGHFTVNNYISAFTFERDNNTREVSMLKQLSWLQDTLNNPFKTSYIYCLSGEYYSKYAQAIALMVFYNAIGRYQQSPTIGHSMPYWHYTLGKFEDRLRDNESFKNSIGKPSMLIIDGGFNHSAPSRLETIRDLLQLYSDVPRLVITAGCNPLDFCYNQIYTSVSKVLYLSMSRTVQI